MVVGHESVKTTTLDAYIERNAVRHVDLIKMDIEGAELLALKGASGLLCRDDGPIILIEIADVNTAGFGYKAKEIIVHLESLGYRVYRFDARGRLHEMTEGQRRNTLEINAIAIKGTHADLIHYRGTGTKSLMSRAVPHLIP